MNSVISKHQGGKNKMQRFAQFSKLKPEKIEEYVKLHADTWPGVLAMIEKCHIANYSIYLLGDMLFTYFEYVGDDYERDMQIMDADPITREWWKFTKPCFTGHEQEHYYDAMQEVFHHD
jgi:L-rhamnose mutarotase